MNKMITKYNDFLNEKLSDKLSGFNEEELKQQFLNGKLDFKKYLENCKENNIKINKDEIKNWYLNGKINESFEYFHSVCESFNCQPFSEQEIVDILKIEKYDDPYNMLIDSIKYKLNDIFDIAITKNDIYENIKKILKIIAMYGNIYAFNYLNKNFHINKYMLTNMLQFSIYNSQYNLIKILIENGADIYDSSNKFLRSTITNEDFECFKFIVDNYYDINKDNDILFKNVLLTNKPKFINYLINNGLIPNKNYLNISMYNNIRDIIKKYYNE